MNIKPLGNNVVVKAVSEEETTQSGIILPDTVNKEKPEKGEVIAIGPGKLMDNGSKAAMNVQVGDKVIFKKYSPDEIKLREDGKEVEYLILSEDDILAIVV